jgi:hypothetical protein
MTKFNLSLTKEQLGIINAALMEAPYRIAAPLVQDLNLQIQRQFDLAADAHGVPSGSVMPPDPYKGD